MQICALVLWSESSTLSIKTLETVAPSSRYICLHEGHFAGMNVVHGAYQSDLTLVDHIQ